MQTTINATTTAKTTTRTTAKTTPENEPTTQPTAPTSETTASHRPDADKVRAAIERRSFAMLSTVSPAGVPHAAGVLYELVGSTLYVNTLRPSRKARNVEASGRAAVCLPIRRVPIGGPPSTVQFQAKARVLATDDPEITRLVDAGELSSLTSHGELDLADGCFLAIELPRRANTYGLGMSLRKLIGDPLGAGGSVEF